MHRLALLGLFASACRTAAPAPPVLVMPPHRDGVPPPSDEAGLRKLLVGEVKDGGLWFADAACEAKFGKPAKLGPSAFDEFAHCVAGLHLRPSARADALDDVSVLTYEPGFEVEAKVTNGTLDFIGFTSRDVDVANIPMITPEAFELLRAAGDRNVAVATPHPGNATYHAHVEICLDEGGLTTRIEPAGMVSPARVHDLVAVAHDWAFKPFVVGEVAMPVCAIVPVNDGAVTSAVDRVPEPAGRSAAGNLRYWLDYRDHEHARIRGAITIRPDDDDKIVMQKAGVASVIGAFRLCLDEGGKPEAVKVVKSTGVSNYDLKIARTIMSGWAFQPLVVDRRPVPICSIVSFVYTIR